MTRERHKKIGLPNQLGPTGSTKKEKRKEEKKNNSRSISLRRQTDTTGLLFILKDAKYTKAAVIHTNCFPHICQSARRRTRLTASPVLSVNVCVMSGGMHFFLLFNEKKINVKKSR